MDINHNINLENDKKLNEFDEDINKIIKDKNAKYPPFLMENATKLLLNREEKKNLEEYQDIHDKLVNYMILKRSQKAYKELEEKRKEKKLFII